LSLPQDQQGQTWTNTFEDSNYQPTGGTVHWNQYNSSSPNKPNSWTEAWFKNWTWINQ
jgi:hypothetical protein